MRAVIATLLAKAVIVVGLFEAMLPAVGRVGPVQALWLAAAVGALTYALGDRLALAARGNATAVVLDFIVAVGALYALGRLTPGVRLPFGGALTVGGTLAVAEILFHQYLLQKGVGTR